VIVFVKDMIASPLIAVGGLALVIVVRPDALPRRCQYSRCGRRHR
jgi:hypothetical protein